MKELIRPVQFVYFIYSAVLFVCLLLIITPLVILSSFFGKEKGGNFVYQICRVWSAIWMFMIGVRPRIIYEQSHDSQKQYIFVANHWSYMDVPMTVNIIHQPFRALGKYELSKVPIFGFLYRNAVVMVDRSSPANRAKSVQVLKSVLKNGISVIIFPEGTFNMTNAPLKEFFDGAFRIAIETQTPIKPIIFPDTLARYGNKYGFELSPGKCRGVFLQEVPVEGLTINDLPALKLQVHTMMEERIVHYTSNLQ